MDSLSLYTHEEFSSALLSIVRERFRTANLAAPDKPEAVLLGGQSGAGKTTLHVLKKKEFCKNVIIINGDDYRRLHPRYKEIDAAFGVDSPAQTAAWAGAMTEALIDEFSLSRRNLIIEGTLRTSQVPLKTAGLLRERGYGVSLALMAVKPEISLISCQIRYEEMLALGTIPRATDPAYHDKIVRDIVENIRTLEESGQFDKIELFSRSKRCLFNTDVNGKGAADAMHEILFGPWTDEELMHYEALKRKLEVMRC